MAIVALVPLAFYPGGYFIFLPLKVTLATVLVPVGLAVLIARRHPLAWTAQLGAWLTFLVVLVASSLLGLGGVTSWIGYPGRGLGVVAWLVFAGAFWLGSSLSRQGDRAAVVRAATAASILVSIYALFQAAGLDPLDWAGNIDVSRTRSTMGNAAFLGAYLAMIVPLAGSLALSTSQPHRARALYSAASILAFAALLSTRTRGAWVGALAGLVVVVALEWPRIRAARGRLAGALVAATALLVLLATVSPLASRIRSVADPKSGTGRGRLIQWGRTIELIAERPVVGWGPETYAFVFPRFIDERFERTVGRAVIPDRAHNVFLDVASATGLLGVVAYLGILALSAWALVRARLRNPLTVGLAGACAAYVIQLQFSFPLADLDAVFWLLAGLLVASTTPRSGVLRHRWAAVPLVAALLLAFWGATDVAADRILRRSLEAEATGRFSEAQGLIDRAAHLAAGRVQYLQAAGRLHRRIGEVSGRADDFRRGLQALDEARRLLPRDLELAMDRADLFLSWGQIAGDRGLIQRAASQYEKILELDPASSRVHLRLGVAFVELDRRVDAEKEWLMTVSLSPSSPGPLVNLGILYEQQGRREEALAVLRQALKLDPTNSIARGALRRLAS
jgi:O-antigen ligase/Flp pilus assembly protein TadD